MTTRHNSPKTENIAPKNTNGWNSLLSAAIKRAEAKGDNRLASLRSAMVNGKAESVLRKYGIISEADIIREFSE